MYLPNSLIFLEDNIVCIFVVFVCTWREPRPIRRTPLVNYINKYQAAQAGTNVRRKSINLGEPHQILGFPASF